jgi:putative transposase
MARMPGLVVPDYPHHVTQRGIRRMKTFFNIGDYKYYLDLIARCKAEVPTGNLTCHQNQVKGN